MKFPVNALKYLPNFFIKNFIMKTIVKSHSGPLGWIKSKDRGRTKAFFGSLKKRGNIKEWENFSIDDDYSKKLVLNHGYNEEKDENLLALEDMREVAKFRGGECLSHSMTEGDLETKLKWKCAFSHEFIASPRLILKGGHWCEECEAPPWNFDEIARKNPFFRQVWKVK